MCVCEWPHLTVESRTPSLFPNVTYANANLEVVVSSETLELGLRYRSESALIVETEERSIVLHVVRGVYQRKPCHYVDILLLLH